MGTVEAHPPTQVDSCAARHNLLTPQQPIQEHSLGITPSRRLSREYNTTCKTHRKLVKAGSITCSVRLSNSPVGQATTNIDSSEGRGPATKVEGSVHWGALRDSSGFQTPGTTPNQSPPVFTPDLIPPLHHQLYPPGLDTRLVRASQFQLV